MLNRITIMGRVTHTPEMRATSGGIPVCEFSIACERDKRNALGTKETDFINIVTFRGTAEFVAQWFEKGRTVYVDGRLQMRKYQDKQGNNRTVYEIYADNVGFVGPKEESGRDRRTLPDPSLGQYARPSAPAQEAEQATQEAFDALGEEEGGEDRVPF